MASVKEPTYEGVSRVKLLLEAGFLYSKLGELRFDTLKNQIFNETLKFQETIINIEDQNNYKSVKLKLHNSVYEGWKVVRDNTNGFHIFF
jgi:signal transduction histidine kinase